MNIKVERVRKNITQSELAEAIGISTNTLQKYEKGIDKIPSGKLIAMAELFDCSTDYLLGLTEERK